MSIDVLQAKIRKTKNPSMICIAPSVLELPMPIKDAARAQYGDTLRAAAESYRQFSFGILDALKDVVPAVSIVSGAFAALGSDGVAAMDLLRGPRPMTPYDSQFLRDRLRGKEYLPLAYFDGATPQNGYRPTAPYTLTVLPDQRPQDVEEGYLRVFLQTAGADAPRPVKLRQKPSTGEWFLWEYSSPLSGIRIPASQDPWA